MADTNGQLAIAGPPSYSPEWYAMRKFDPERERPVIFGASEAAAACNVSNYDTPLSLYLEKRGEYQREFTPEQQERIDFGHAFETPVADYYDKVTGYCTERNLPLYLSPDHSFFAATPDAIANKKQKGNTLLPIDRSYWRCVEVKTTNWRMIDSSGNDESKFGDPGTDQVPVEYLMQAQQQMGVLGLSVCDIPVLADAKISIYTINRNDEIITQIISAERELEERIINGDPPEPSYEHAGTLKLLQQMYGFDVGEVVELDRDLAALWRINQRHAEKIKDLKKIQDEIKARILHAMGSAEIGRFEGEEFELKRTVVKDKIGTDMDVERAKSLVGQVIRKGHVRISQRKVKMKK